MRPRFDLPLLLAAAVLVALVACQATPQSAPRSETAAAQWQRVADSATQVAYLDTSSLERTGEGLRATVKINYSTPQTFSGNTYLSARSVYVLDCTGRRIADRENAVYTEADLEGRRISRASRSTSNLIWRDAAAGSIDGELLSSACRRSP